MKTLNLLILAFGLLTFNSFGQTRTAKFVQFNNFTATFEVPEGKTWVVNSIFSNSIGELIKNTDGTITTLPVRIFIKAINGDIKTDYEGNRYGPQVYQSDNTAATVAFPLTFPEGTKFSLVIVVGNAGSMKMFNGSGFISYFEVTNYNYGE